MTTHDLPPTAGYLAGEHVRLRDQLGLLTRPVDEELADDRAEQAAWLDELRRRRPAAATTPTSTQIVLALYRYLGRTPSRLLGLALADAVGDVRTQNQPGTTDEYPNWRVPLSGPDGRRLLLEDVFSDSRAPRARRGHAGGREAAGVTLRWFFTGFTFVTAAICSHRTDLGRKSRENSLLSWELARSPRPPSA